MTHPTMLTASETVRLVHGGEVSVTGVVRSLLDHAQAHDGSIRAWATLDAEGALSAAAELDRLRGNGARLPLHGVGVAVKDIIDVAGLPTIAGFAPFSERIARRDAAIVKALRAAGAVILGKAHTTQFAAGDPAPTRNPWKLERSPAGSSAGSAAAVAARMAPLALGTQTAGSVLRPAAFCGVVGYKPAYGWFDVDGVLPLCWSLDHIGLYTRTVEDMALAYGTLHGSAAPATPPGDGVSAARFILLPEFLEMSEPEVAEHVSGVADQLRGAGATVVERSLPDTFDHIFAVHQLIFASESAAVHGANLSRQREHYGPRLRDALDAGTLLPATYVLHARRHRRRVSRLMDELLSTTDALILPTVSTEACDLAETGDRRFQTLATLLGLPAISLPTGLSRYGLPLATQLIGPRAGGGRLLDVARRVVDVVGQIGSPDLDG
jgi:aspartyl-tRNA(Asn)/glutamyl-tRNA(Gln) amidotransferase subunit A